MNVYCRECRYLEIDSMTLCEENIDYLCNHLDNKKCRLIGMIEKLKKQGMLESQMLLIFKMIVNGIKKRILNEK